MNIPDWLKPVTLGFVIGAVAASSIGFSWGNWATGGNAAKMAHALSHDKVIAAFWSSLRARQSFARLRLTIAGRQLSPTCLE